MLAGIALGDGPPALVERRPVAGQEFRAAGEDGRDRDLVGLVGFELVQDDRRLELGQVFLDLPDLLDLAQGGDDRPAARMGEAERQVREVLDLDRDGDVDRPDVEHPELAHDPVVPAVGDERHAVALADAQGEQAGGEEVDALPHLGVGRGLVAVGLLLQHHGLAGVAGDGGFEQPGQGSLWIHGVPPRWAGQSYGAGEKSKSADGGYVLVEDLLHEIHDLFLELRPLFEGLLGFPGPELLHRHQVLLKDASTVSSA